ncbi:hypothetical protein Rsub_02576 [Raphidocelis subcapitata]|uniref:Alpha-1,2-mannosyltransferase n=1 Tax=Raphidocelis subcapitata TaxID=307507 RepID=A0A2V0NT78_9CHLO|nr:hypothetical protein Rsub_02576 [Raphidocelis subcapitata]|eukprot:GBF89872.1 hypothetical protein Rsub_02576 [Raphidocelis subcapitata]
MGIRLAACSVLIFILKPLYIAALETPDLEPPRAGPPLQADAAADPLAFARRVLQRADATAKLDAQQAAALLQNVLRLGDSLSGGAAAERWRALQARRAARLRDLAAAGAGGQRQECAWQPEREHQQHQQQQKKDQQQRQQDQQQQNQECASVAPEDKPLPPAASAAAAGAGAADGVLVVAGGANGLSNAYVLARALRAVGCALPVEVVYYGAREHHAGSAELLRSLDGAPVAPAGAGAAAGAAAPTVAARLRLVDGAAAAPARPEPHRAPLGGGVQGFAAKVHALTFVTSFDRVLMLDADNTPVQDPTPLFDNPAFLRHGSLFWPDFWTDMWVNTAVYRLLNMPVPWEADPSELAAEAGQVLVDRVRHYDALEYAWLLMNEETVKACLWGDKDVYRIAFHLAGKGGDYSPVAAAPRQLLGGAPGGVLFHLGMAQLAPDGASVMFCHRTAAGKLFPDCITRRGAGWSCVPSFISLELDQAQLLASVRDPTFMEFAPSAVDTAWHEAHCRAPPEAAARAPGPPRLGDPAAAALPRCEDGWQGRRPVPLLPIRRVHGVEALLRWVHSEAFAAALEHHARAAAQA